MAFFIQSNSLHIQVKYAIYAKQKNPFGKLGIMGRATIYSAKIKGQLLTRARQDDELLTAYSVYSKYCPLREGISFLKKAADFSEVRTSTNFKDYF